MDDAKANAMLADGSGMPRRFGKYELLERIGVGGMAEIFKARFTGIAGFEKLVVVKRILPNFASNRSFIRMLINEAKIASALQHPNVVQIFDLGQVEEQHYIAMEIVHGKDLLKVLSRCVKLRERIPLKLTLHIVAEVCKGLAYAHSGTDLQGRPLHIVHRDVSPSNVLMSFAGEVKITDFGVARARTQQRPNTRSGVLKGKLGYMSPEQVMGKEIDYRSDIFALGTVLFETITLKRLFLGKADLETLVNIRDVRIDHRLARHRYIPERVVTVLRKALSRDPGDRFVTAMDFHDAIVDFMYDKGLRVTQRDLSDFLGQLFRADTAAGRAVLAPASPEDVALARGAAEADALSDGGEEAPAFRVDDEDQSSVPAGAEASSSTRSAPGAGTDPNTSPRGEGRGSAKMAASEAVDLALAGADDAADLLAFTLSASDGPAGRPARVPAKGRADDFFAPRSAEPEPEPDGAPREAAEDEGPSGPVEDEPSRRQSSPGATETPFGPSEARAPSAERSGLHFELAEASEASGELPNHVLARLGGSAFRLRDSLGNIFGPVSFHNFVNLIKARALTESELVSVDGGEWRAARSVPGIREIRRSLFRPETGQPSFSGEVRHVELPRLLYRMWAEKLSGKLKFRFQTTRKEIYFLDGRPRHIASSLKGELIGSHLVARKLVTPAQIQTAIQRMTSTEEKIGDAIVSLGYLRHHELYEAFQQLHRRKFLQVFVWNTGRYEFYKRGKPPSGVILLDLDVPKVVAEGVREFFGFTELKRYFKPHYHHELVKTASKRPKVGIQDLRFNAQEARFSGQIQEGGTLVDILRTHAKVNRDALTMFRVLFLLVQMELIRFEAQR